MDNEVYDGVLKTKKQAQQQYTQAVLLGQSAGIVRYKLINWSTSMSEIDIFSYIFVFSYFHT